MTATDAKTTRFGLLWAAQTLSLSCQGLTSFSLGVWVFLQTGSATRFALMELVGVLPGLLTLPLSGVLTDRLGPRRSLLLSDAWGLVAGLVLASLFVGKLATPGLLLLVLTGRNLVTAMHWPAYTAATTALVGPERVARSGALMQLGFVGQQVMAPALAGMLLSRIGVAGIIGIDVCSFGVALLTTLLTRFPEIPQRPRESFFVQLRGAFAMAEEHGLLKLARYTAATHVAGGFVIALATPLLLSVTTPKLLGVTNSAMGLGMLLGIVVAARFVKSAGGMKRMLRYDALSATMMIAIGFGHAPLYVGVLGFLYLFGLAGNLAEEQALWQVRIPAEAQGRVFALRRLLTFAALPISYAVAGPLADRLFEPLARSDVYRNSVLAPIFGVGAGRGIALLLVCAGIWKAVIILRGARSASLRRLNAIPDGNSR